MSTRRYRSKKTTNICFFPVPLIFSHYSAMELYNLIAGKTFSL